MSHGNWIKVPDAAAILDCSRVHIYKLIKRGKLRAYRVATRLRLRHEDVEKMITVVDPTDPSQK
ncbi:helix-turn-helix domain-containing protein [Anaeromyxobacter oryzisoli]|uniref:helix-turn-helix domain-containing protein n=1 Tax=Anaeromyxobacter oryzisoli TaxID=2925408 RepID=UPI001F564DD7|nr:helix-turn-helix domain-containing protein [Anaeromyxobacter sp. SG63]